MEKPTMSNMSGMHTMNDTLEFVKNMWGGMKMPGTGMPGMVMPTLSVEKINQQIADLKAVESWLHVNMNMLRASIQALEVQSATLATLKAMGDNFNTAMHNAAAAKPADAPPPDAAADSQARRKTRSRHKEEETQSGQPEREQQEAEHCSNDQTDFSAQFANPAAWWNLMQEQLKQATAHAMAAENATPPSRTDPNQDTSQHKPDVK